MKIIQKEICRHTSRIQLQWTLEETLNFIECKTVQLPPFIHPMIVVGSCRGDPRMQRIRV